MGASEHTCWMNASLQVGARGGSYTGGGSMVQAWGWPGAAMTWQAAWGGQAEGGAELGPPEAFSQSLVHSLIHSLASTY